jgi:hypothetical protein
MKEQKSKGWPTSHGGNWGNCAAIVALNGAKTGTKESLWYIILESCLKEMWRVEGSQRLMSIARSWNLIM